MKFLECDLEEIIMKSENHKLRDRGLEIIGKKRNQVRIGNYGIADIIVFDKGYFNRREDGIVETEKPTVTVYELKKDNVSLSSFAQVCNYVKGVKDYFEHTNRDVFDYKWKVVLIGKNVDKNSSLVYFPELFCSTEDSSIQVEIYEYNYGLDGIEFNQIYDYSLIKKGFNYE